MKIMDFSDNKLLKNIKKNLPNLEKLLEEIKDHWAEEDLIYRYYHNSFKVYRIQSLTSSILKALNDISPHEDKKIPNESYLKIIADGSGKVWKPEHNRNWDEITRPMLEAFFHSKYFLEMAIKYGKQYKKAPQLMDSGWAALLELYNIR